MKEIRVNVQYFATLVGKSHSLPIKTQQLSEFDLLFCIVSLTGFLYGIMCGWSSPAIFLLTSDKSPLSTGKITVDQASWITSLNAAGMMITSIFVGSLANKYGRKWPLILLTIPSIVSGIQTSNHFSAHSLAWDWDEHFKLNALRFFRSAGLLFIQPKMFTFYMWHA